MGIDFKNVQWQKRLQVNAAGEVEDHSISCALFTVDHNPLAQCDCKPARKDDYDAIPLPKREPKALKTEAIAHLIDDMPDEQFMAELAKLRKVSAY